MCTLQNSVRDRAKREQRVEDQKGGGRIQRGHQPVCDLKVFVIKMRVKALCADKRLYGPN